MKKILVPESLPKNHPSGSELSGAELVYSFLDDRVQSQPALQTFAKGVPIAWTEVDDSATAFAAGLLVRHAPGPLCFVCPDARMRERLAGELPVWAPEGVVFPELSMAVVDGALPDPETLAERLEILFRLKANQPPRWLLVSEEQLKENVLAPDHLLRGSIALRAGADFRQEELIGQLDSWEYEKVPQVYARGQYALRGGILDIFCWHRLLPLRLEFFGDLIESIREFDLHRQTSLNKLDAAEVIAGTQAAPEVKFGDWLEGFHRILIEPTELPGEGFSVIQSALDPERPSPLPVHDCPAALFSPGDFISNETRRTEFFADLQQWQASGWRVVVFCDNEGEWERFRELLQEHGRSVEGLIPCRGQAARSFLCPDAKLVVLTDADLFGRPIDRRLRGLSRKREHWFASRSTEDFSEYVEGDLVVHLEHGIGRYLGMQRIEGQEGEVLALEFANEARLYVPIAEAWQISRYVSAGRKQSPLSELGSGKWEKAKAKTRRAVFAYAEEMLRLQAQRETARGEACPPDGHWQEEFERSFIFQPTPDQTKAIVETKRDMEDEKPMDRLICGDVGFGKTEVAIRAAFKSVMGGRQVAFLAPTTVLAQQHYQTLRERMSDYPFRIELLSRYRTKKEQSDTIQRLAAGEVDIVVGTHRLISPDVEWKNLGLLVVDEEQRFGVRHKELLKQRFQLVDVLTLSATPIPRTLYLALMGARDMSVIDTPPPNRQPVETLICAYDERLIRDAILRELKRGGQVYLLHNRVATIEKLAGRIRHLIPSARVDIGHGQMPEGDLEEVMQRFVDGKTDVLVSTTIIESGLDIPNANTILIDRADRFGLADLYQLRGRVGRAGEKAYAYLLLPRSLLTVGAARKRISAIKQYSQLGAGFRIAMRDLEIRGAGNLLGTAQSGHIVVVGFDLYCKMLRVAVQKLQGEPTATRRDCLISLDFLRQEESEAGGDTNGLALAFLPTGFIQASKHRIEAYRRFHEALSSQELWEIGEEWRDRFGPLPQSVKNLLLLGELRLEGISRFFSRIEVRDSKLMLTRRGDYLLLGGKFPRLKAVEPNSRLREVLDAVKSFRL